MKKFKVTGNAASELDIRLEVAEVGDEDWGLLAQWTGSHIIAFDEEHAERLAWIACGLGNDLDSSLPDVAEDDKKATRLAANGLWKLSERLREYARKKVA